MAQYSLDFDIVVAPVPATSVTFTAELSDLALKEILESAGVDVDLARDAVVLEALRSFLEPMVMRWHPVEQRYKWSATVPPIAITMPELASLLNRAKSRAQHWIDPVAGDPASAGKTMPDWDYSGEDREFEGGEEFERIWTEGELLTDEGRRAAMARRIYPARLR